MNVLDENLIGLNVDANSAEACIRYAADLFLKHGYVREGYGDAVVLREKTYPTGLPGKGINIAIPHTNNSLVIKPAVGVLIPKAPVEFMMMGTKDKPLSCDLILPLVIKDSRMQITMLRKIMKIIGDSETLAKIKASKSKKEIMQYLGSLNME